MIWRCRSFWAKNSAFVSGVPKIRSIQPVRAGGNGTNGNGHGGEKTPAKKPAKKSATPSSPAN